MSKEELADLRWWLERKDDHESELKNLQGYLTDPEFVGVEVQVYADIEHTQYILSIIECGINSRAGKPCLERLKGKNA
jgi:hypothetical protein